MATPQTNPTWRWLVLLGIATFSAVLVFVGCRHAIAEYRAGSPDPSEWLRAAQLEPANAENWYRLGRYRQLDFENSDLPQAISYYERATAVDPRPARYWLDLAESYESTGNIAQAEVAFREAQQDYPLSADVAWRLGNFLLRQGRAEEAFREIRRAVSVNPKLTPNALSLSWRSTRDIDLILREALPADPKVDWAAIQFFTNPHEPDAAVAVWKRLMMDGPALSSISQVFPLVDMLVESKHADDAQMVWRQALSAASIAQPPGPPHSLVWDGGFEGPLLNGGFAWRYVPTAGAQVDLDEQTVHSGGRSVRVVFDGSQNADFSDLWQYVVVQPNTRYTFNSYLRTQDLTTDSGVRFEIIDANRVSDLNVLTPGATGTQPWTLDEVGFTTGPNTRVLRIAVRRPKSQMLAGKIRGTAWVDDVSLVPSAGTPPRADPQ
jgi:tetratricopeptide (TPR) repeat protein